MRHRVPPGSERALQCRREGGYTKILNRLTFYTGKKDKAVQLQAWNGPEGSRKLRFPDFTTIAQGGGKVVIFTHRLPLPTVNTPGTHFC